MFQGRYNRIVLPFFFLFDIFVTLFIASFDNYLYSIENNNYASPFLACLFWAIPSLIFKSYKVPRVISFTYAARSTLLTFLCFLFLNIVFFLKLSSPASIAFAINFIFHIAIAQFSISYIRYLFFLNYRRKGKNYLNAVFLGKINNQKMKSFKVDSRNFGYHFIENFQNSENYINNLNMIILKEKVQIVFLLETENYITELIRVFCDAKGIRLKILISITEETRRLTGLDIIGGYLAMDLRHEPLLYLGNRIIKHTFDLIFSFISILFVLSWLPIVVKFFQVLSYPGPLFFIQDRVGHNGKKFRLYKFRTMKFSKDNNFAQKGKSKITKIKDKRIAWFGSLLRKSNFDEYPQFLNVLFGSMSIVGPRPYMIGEDIALEKNINKYRIRRFAKPGISGWAAVNGYRGGTDDLKLMSKRTEYDIWYLENWTLWLDLKIIFITIWQMVRLKVPKAY